MCSFARDRTRQQDSSTGNIIGGIRTVDGKTKYVHQCGEMTIEPLMSKLSGDFTSILLIYLSAGHSRPAGKQKHDESTMTVVGAFPGCHLLTKLSRYYSSSVQMGLLIQLSSTCSVSLPQVPSDVLIGGNITANADISKEEGSTFERKIPYFCQLYKLIRRAPNQVLYPVKGVGLLEVWRCGIFGGAAVL